MRETNETTQTVRKATGHSILEEAMQKQAEQKEKTKKRKRKGEKGDLETRCDKVTITTSPWELVERAAAEPRAQRPRGKGTGHGKTTQQYNEEYEKYRPRIMETIYSLESDPAVETMCACQHAGRANTNGDGQSGPEITRLRVWRCMECVDQGVCCADCLRERHAAMPFHRVQKWNGEFFEHAALSDCGVCIVLGHQGQQCANPGKTINATIADVSGIHEIPVILCGCRVNGEDAQEAYEQFFAARLFPATFIRPATAYTFRLLDHWHMDVLQGKKPIYDYWLSLQRRTKQVAKDLTGYKTFRRIARFWRDLTSRRQSGQGQGIDAFLPENRYAGSVAVVCPACPEPGFNLPDDWLERIKQPDERVKYSKVLCLDASYKACSKAKNNDDEDRPLNAGGAYFSDFDETKSFRTQHANEKPENAGPCPGVDNMHRFAGGKNTVYSGIAAVVCRHDAFFPRSVVNLEKGERFALLDLSLKNALGPHPSTDIPYFFSSDRACQLCVNVVRRWRNEFAEQENDAHQRLLADVIWAIPKLHIQGHKEDCQYSMHFAYLTGGGRTCGEGIERAWPETNATGMISKDANIGNREDIINDTHGDWNHKKAMDMAAHLLRKAKDAAENLVTAKKELDDYAASLDNGKIGEWVEKHPSELGTRDASGHVTSRYRADLAKVPGRQELSKMIKEKEQRGGGPWANGRSPESFLKRLIELEAEQMKLKERVKNATESAVVKESIDKERVNMRVKIKLVRNLQRVHMPGIQELLTADEETSESVDEDDTPEEDALYFPSNFTDPEERKELDLTKLAKLEMKIRRICAESELESLKLTMRMYMNDLKSKRVNIQGTAANTRAQAKIKQEMKKRDEHFRRYNAHFDAMVRLGYDLSDRHYRRLEKDIVEAPESVAEPRPLGAGRAPEQWYWREGKDVARIQTQTEKQLAALNDEEQRVRYFRLWADWKRWEEEWIIVGAELDRTVRHFSKMEEVWKHLAGTAKSAVQVNGDAVKSPGAEVESGGHLRRTGEEAGLRVREAEGKRAYAFKKSAFYRGLKENAIAVRQTAGKLNNGLGWDEWKPRVEQPSQPSRKKARRM